MPHNEFKKNLRGIREKLQMVQLLPHERDMINLHLSKMNECFNDFIEESRSPLVKVVEENTAVLNKVLEKLYVKSEGEKCSEK